MRAGIKLTILTAILIALFTVGVAAAQDTDRGGELYQTYCAMCHGEDGGGRVGADLNNFPGIDTSAAISQVILNGISGSPMPSFGVDRGGPLSEGDAEDISAYLIGVLDGTSPVVPAPTYIAPSIPPLPDVEGSPSNGAIVFQQNCAVCHGEGSQGRLGETLAKNWPGVQPEAYLSDVISRGIRGSIMPAWAQAEGGPLAVTEIADVTSYILSLEPTDSEPEIISVPEGPLNMTISIILFAGIGLAILVGLFIYYKRA